MTKHFDNYTITDTADKVVVDYDKTLKDWFDTVITLAIGLFLTFATYLLLQQGFKTTSYIVIAGGLVFAFQAILQSASGFSRLFQPTKNLLIIDKNAKTLFSKRSLFNSKKIFLDEIETLIVSGQKDKLFSKGSKNQMTRTYCNITAKLKDITYKDRPSFVLLPINNLFCVNLEKLRVVFPDTEHESMPPPPPPPGKGVNFNDIINRGEVNSAMCFTKSDSAFFVFQNDTLNHFTFNTQLTKKLNTTIYRKQKNRKDSYYSCSIPIFSSDKTKAYVEIANHCYGLCGGVTAYILKKLNGHWTIIRQSALWIG